MKKIAYRIALYGRSIEVNGYAFEHNGFRLCARKSTRYEGPWSVDEYDTGLCVVSKCHDRDRAVLDAVAKLDQYGPKKTQKAINTGLKILSKHGLIP